MIYIDLNKGRLNRSKLVKKPVLVKKRDGKTHIRNQWVDPTTGLAKEEGKQSKFNESERWSTGNQKSTPRKKVKMYNTAHNLIIKPGRSASTKDMSSSNNSQKNISTGSFLSMSSDISLNSKPKLKSTSLTKDSRGIERTPFWNANIDGLLPHEVDEEGYIKEELLEKRQNTIYPAPLSIRNYDTGLSEYEIDDRCGMIGPIDMDNARVGMSYQDWDVYNSFLDEFKDKEERSKYEARWNNLFGNYSVDTLQSALAGEHGTIVSIEPREMSDADGYLGFTMNMELKNDKGDIVGNCTRTFHRDSNSTIHHFNDELDIKEQYQNIGIANDLYDRQIQLLKHMSRGHVAYNHLTANISVGKYAWAGKGYDFKNQSELNSARKRLTTFCKAQGIDTDTLVQQCGYNSINDINHSWQFAALDNGKKYTLSDKHYSNIKGEGHFGKAFMLGGMSMWEGVLAINANSLGEKLNNKSRNK